MPQFNFPSPLDPDRLFKMLSESPEFNSASRIVTLNVAAVTLNQETHDGRTMLFDLITGVTVTLPTSSGSGARYMFKVKTLATSNSYIVKVGNATDIIQGAVHMVDTDTAGTTTAFATAGTSDTVTLNRSTTGSVTKGEWFEIEDTVKGIFTIRGVLTNSGDGATPFSATV